MQNNTVPSNNQKVSGKLGPCLLGDPPKINVVPPEVDEEESLPATLPVIKIYDADVSMRFLVCGAPSALVGFGYKISSLYLSLGGKNY